MFAIDAAYYVLEPDVNVNVNVSQLVQSRLSCAHVVIPQASFVSSVNKLNCDTHGHCYTVMLLRDLGMKHFTE